MKNLSPHQTRLAGYSLILFVATLLAFSPSFSGTWLFDDTFLISENGAIKSWSHFSDWWSGDLFEVRSSAVQLASRQPFYRPVVVTSYALNWLWSGGSPAAFHAVNVVLHATVTVLSFFFLLRVFGRVKWAFLSALLFALHPTKAESVAWISGRTDVLAVVFLLLAATCYSRQLSTGGRGRLAWSAAKWTFALLSLLSKETAVLFPLLFFLEYWAFLGRIPLSIFCFRGQGLVRQMAPPTLVVIVYIVARSRFLPFTQSGLVPADFSWTHLQFIFATVGENVRLILFPEDLSLYATRLRFDGSRLLIDSTAVIAGVLIAFLCLLGLVLLLIRRSTPLVLLGVFFLASYAPTSQLVPTSLAYLTQARFLYLPLLPIAGLLLWPLSNRPRWLWTVGLGGVLLCLVLSMKRSADFQSPERFWGYELFNNPDVPEVLKQRVIYDAVDGGAQLALRRAMCASRASQQRFLSMDTDWFVLKILANHTVARPDGDVELLRSADFLRALRLGQDAMLSGAVELALPAASAAAEKLRAKSSRMLLFEAELRRRIAQEDIAMDLGRRALVLCPRCDDLSFQAARLALFAGEASQAAEWAQELPQERKEQWSRAMSLWRQTRTLRGSAATWAQIQIGLLLDDSGYAFRAALPQLSEIARHAPPEVIAAVARAARASGQLAPSFQLFHRLPPEVREELVHAGFSDPLAERDEPFVAQTCALPSEIGQ